MSPTVNNWSLELTKLLSNNYFEHARFFHGDGVEPSRSQFTLPTPTKLHSSVASARWREFTELLINHYIIRADCVQTVCMAVFCLDTLDTDRIFGYF